MRRRSDFDELIARSSRRISAAEGVFQGRMSDFMSALMVGCDSERQQARDAVLAAQEALLDAYDANAWVLLQRDGVDPRRRHL